MTGQQLVHWLEVGPGAKWVRLGAVLLGGIVLSLLVAWKQFHGPLTEVTLLQADTGRQIASGAGFTTLVNYPQTSAVMAARGMRFDPEKPYPELHQAPLYPVVIAAGLRLLPSKLRETLLSEPPVPPNGFGGDYFLLGLNLVLFWLAAWLTYLLGTRLFSPRVGWLSALALLISVSAWQQVVAVNGTPLLMVLAVGAFLLWRTIDERAETLAKGEATVLPFPALAGIGLLCGLLFLAEYSAGVLVVLVLAHVMWRYRGAVRLFAAATVAAVFLAVIAPWVIRNVRLVGYPTALARQDIALKAGDPTAEPATVRARFSTELAAIDLNKLGNKTLTTVQENVKSGLWARGGLFLTAFFVAGWLYAFRAPVANRLRWVFTLSLAVAIGTHAVFGSGESDRLPIHWLSPVVIIFGAGFFFVLLEANAVLANWPRAAAAVLLLAQGLPLVRDALEPRRFHFNYPPYFPPLIVNLRQDFELRQASPRFGMMADVPAGVAWYGRQRVWAQPERLKDFYWISNEQTVGELMLTPRTLDRPFFSELGARGALSGIAPKPEDRFGEWGQIYAGILTLRVPTEFPLKVPQKVTDNFYVLFNPALPPVPGK